MDIMTDADGFRCASVEYTPTGEIFHLREISGRMLRDLQELPADDIGQAVIGMCLVDAPNGCDTLRRMFESPRDALEAMREWPVGKIRTIEGIAEQLNSAVLLGPES
jgi:hypothetical protein